MAPLLERPQYAIPCVRRDSGMYSLISADAEAINPDQTAPWIAPMTNSSGRCRTTPYAAENPTKRIDAVMRNRRRPK